MHGLHTPGISCWFQIWILVHMFPISQFLKVPNGNTSGEIWQSLLPQRGVEEWRRTTVPRRRKCTGYVPTLPNHECAGERKQISRLMSIDTGYHRDMYACKMYSIYIRIIPHAQYHSIFIHLISIKLGQLWMYCCFALLLDGHPKDLQLCAYIYGILTSSYQLVVGHADAFRPSKVLATHQAGHFNLMTRVDITPRLYCYKRKIKEATRKTHAWKSIYLALSSYMFTCRFIYRCLWQSCVSVLYTTETVHLHGFRLNGTRTRESYVHCFRKLHLSNNSCLISIYIYDTYNILYDTSIILYCKIKTYSNYINYHIVNISNQSTSQYCLRFDWHKRPKHRSA